MAEYRGQDVKFIFTPPLSVQAEPTLASETKRHHDRWRNSSDISCFNSLEMNIAASAVLSCITRPGDHLHTYFFYILVLVTFTYYSHLHRPLY